MHINSVPFWVLMRRHLGNIFIREIDSPNNIKKIFKIFAKKEQKTDLLTLTFLSNISYLFLRKEKIYNFEN